MTPNALPKSWSPPPRRWINWLIFPVLLAAPSLLFARVLREGAVPWFMDTVMYFYPLRHHAAQLLARGELPYWNRCIMAGTPLFENPQAALTYPLHWPFLALPGGFWFTFPMTLQLGLFGALTFWALTRMGVGRWTAAWAGALALAGGYGWSRLQFGNYLNVLPWWPLWLGGAYAFAFRIDRDGVHWGRGEDPFASYGGGGIGGGAGWLALGALAMALAILGGAHQLAAYGMAGLSAFAVMHVLFDAGRRRRWLVYWVLTVGCGVAMAAPGWIPQWSFIRETARSGGLPAEQVLSGAVATWGELVRALTGDWVRDWARDWTRWGALQPGAPWADAEATATIGLAALVLAGMVPRRGALRLAWGACWLGVLASVALALRPIVEGLMAAFPQSGLFHDPRRWLGLTQWLLILAAGLGIQGMLPRRREVESTARPTAEPVKGEPRTVETDLEDTGKRQLPPSPYEILRWRDWLRLTPAAALLVGATAGFGGAIATRPLVLAPALLVLLTLALAALLRHRAARLGFGGLLLLAVALLGLQTWQTTDLQTIAARRLFDQQPLVGGAELAPGERFFTLDWQRTASYNYVRSDLAEWCLPNWAMLWGLEDLGGYEPAQSRAYRKFMADLHAPEPWRQPYPEHFGLVQNPAAYGAFDAANVRAALMPRWGLPAFTRRQSATEWLGMFPAGMDKNFQIRALHLPRDRATSGPLTVRVREGETWWRYRLEADRPLSTRDDLLAPSQRWRLPRLDPPRGAIMAASVDIPPQFDGPTVWAAQVPPGHELIDLFYWDERLYTHWQPVEIGLTGALLKYEGNPAWTAWMDGLGTAAVRKIGANQVVLNVDVLERPGLAAAETGARLIIHDAWWPGWEGWIDESPAEVRQAGLWREVDIPPGHHTLTLRYRPVTLRLALTVMGLGWVALLLACLVSLRRGRRFPPEYETAMQSSRYAEKLVDPLA